MNTCVLGDRRSTSGRGSAAVTIPERLRANAARPERGDFLRLLHAGGDDEVFGYREVLRAAERYAAFYQARGLAAGAQVVIILRHSLDLYAAFVGALLGGFVPSIWSFPSPKIAESEYVTMLAALLGNARPRLLVTYLELRGRLAAVASPQCDQVSVCTPKQVPADLAALPPGEPPDPDGVAFLQYSSGTTGIKKGVALSHRALLWQVDQYAEAIQLGGDDRIVSWLPLYHDMGLIACLFLPLICRTPLVAMCPFEWVQRPAMWLRAASEFRATLAWLPNFAYSFLAKSVTDEELVDVDLSSLRGVVNCSEPILAESHARFVRRFEPCGLRRSALCGSYAMAENTFAVTSGGFTAPLQEDCIDGPEFARTGRAVPAQPGSRGARTLVSSGVALPETQITIVSDAGHPLPDRQLGEIVLRSPCLLSEYHRNKAATRAAIRDEAYFTGDIGYLADGELYVTGRKKDMLIIRGQNVYPQDVEAIVNETAGVIPGRTAAVGVPNGELGTEDLVILAETHEADAVKRDAIRRDIHQRISQATEITPADVHLCEHMWLRKSTAGKISRTINRDRYLRLRERLDDEHRSRPSAMAQTGGSTLAEVRRCVERVLSQLRSGHRARLTNDNPLVSSGLIDSLGLIELINAIEADCQVSIPAQALTDVSNIDTLRRLAKLVERLRTDGIDDVDVDTFPRCREEVPLRIGEPRTLRRTRGFWSWYYRWVLWRRGVRVGRGLRVLGPLILRFDGDPGNISIGNDVTLMPGVDLKVRENGRITLHDGVLLDTNVRLDAAREGHIELGEDVRLGMSTIINAGAGVIVGRRTAIAGFGLITASEHKYLGREPFMQQGHQHEPVYIGEDVWGAANVFVGRGSRIGNGAVLGVKSVVRGDVPAYGVVMGNPGRVIRFRS